MITTSETLNTLLERLDLREPVVGEGMTLLAAQDHKYLKDLRINVSNVLAYENLSARERQLLALAAVANDRNEQLTNVFVRHSKEAGATDPEVAEVFAAVSLMQINNVFYRFRHFTDQEYYNTTPAGIKMSIMMNPVLGKEFFELLCLVVSALNGCERCVTSHEASVRELGASQTRIYEAIRLGAVIRGLSNLI